MANRTRNRAATESNFPPVESTPPGKEAEHQPITSSEGNPQSANRPTPLGRIVSSKTVKPTKPEGMKRRVGQFTRVDRA